MRRRDPDVIVVGLGGMGSAAAWHLAQRGHRVLGLERFARAHDLGSSHGQTRMVRHAYFEHPDYVPLLSRAYALWDELSAQTSRPVLTRCGGLTIGRPDSVAVRGARTSAQQWGIPHQVLDAAAVRARHPTLRLAGDEVALYEPSGGFVNPEAVVDLHCGLAAQAGAELRFGARVTGWSAGADGVEVVVDGERIGPRRLVLAAGAWTGSLAPGLPVALTPERHVQYWFGLQGDPGRWAADRHPAYLWELPAGDHFYGFPAVAGGRAGVKVAFFRRGTAADPDQLRRAVTDAEADAMRDCIAPRLAGVGPALIAAEPCLYTMTPDHQFIVDHHPQAADVVVVAGFSGHGFKFVPLIGEVVADLVTDGATEHPIDAFSLRPARRAMSAPSADHRRGAVR